MYNLFDYSGGIDILETKEAMGKQDKADKEEAKQRRKEVKRVSDVEIQNI